MYKSIRNVGVFEGGKATMHTRRCALTRVLLWPVHIPLKHRILRSKLDYCLLMLPKQLPWLARFFSSYSKQTINFKKPQFTVTGVLVQGRGIGREKGTLSPPYPPVRSIGPAQKYFPDFHQSDINVLHSSKSCLEG